MSIEDNSVLSKSLNSSAKGSAMMSQGGCTFRLRFKINNPPSSDAKKQNQTRRLDRKVDVVKNWNMMKRGQNFDKCLKSVGTAFLLTRRDSINNSSRIFKDLLTNMANWISGGVSLYFKCKKCVVLKIRNEEFIRSISPKNFTQNKLLKPHETLVLYTHANPPVEWITKLSSNNSFSETDCKVERDFRVGQNCSVMHKSTKNDYFVMGMVVNATITSRYIVVCSRKEVQRQKEPSSRKWPFAIFIVAILCFLLYIFFRTICYKNHGYVRTGKLWGNTDIGW